MDHVPAIAKQAEAWGVDLMNCIAMIPVHDTAFENHRGPTSEEIDNMRQFYWSLCAANDTLQTL